MWTSGIFLVALVIGLGASLESPDPLNDASFLKWQLAQLESKAKASGSTAQPTAPSTAQPTAAPTKGTPATTAAPGTTPAPATRATTPAAVTTLAPTKAPSTCSSIFSCSDCKTAQICRPDGNGGFTEVRTIPCPSSSPYCNYETGTCTSVQSANCGQTDSTFLCLQDGTFPDFSDSTIYHVCQNYEPHKFTCAVPGDNYDAVSETCSPSKTFVTFMCNEAGKKVPYNVASGYYGYCDSNTGAPAVIDRCTGSYQLNVTSQQCEAICTQPGVLPYNSDCTKYYKCDTLWINDSESFLIRNLESCPTGTSFSPSDFICVDENSNPDCPKSP